ncbi:MAG: protein kinase [Clostridiales bacterium]|nr:protein kinase [Clostridiales bacterium]
MSLIDQYDQGRWQEIEALGEGSFGRVYKIMRKGDRTKQCFALKIISVPQNNAEITQLKSEGLDDNSLHQYIDSLVENVYKEINLIKHFRGKPNIVSYEDDELIEKANSPGFYILMRMELLTSLDKHFKKSVSQADVVTIGIDICKALEDLAIEHVIHRDIKPDNILVSSQGVYKLSDFGIARELEKTSSGLSKKGTYSYMAPEIYASKDYGPTVDTYSLGLVMYRLLNNNRTPFLPTFDKLTIEAREIALARRMKGEEAIPPPAFASSELSDIILKACAFDRKDRFADATEMRLALEAVKAAASRSGTGKSPIIDPFSFGTSGSQQSQKPRSTTDPSSSSSQRQAPRPKPDPYSSSSQSQAPRPKPDPYSSSSQGQASRPNPDPYSASSQRQAPRPNPDPYSASSQRQAPRPNPDPYSASSQGQAPRPKPDPYSASSQGQASRPISTNGSIGSGSIAREPSYVNPRPAGGATPRSATVQPSPAGQRPQTVQPSQVGQRAQSFESAPAAQAIVQPGPSAASANKVTPNYRIIKPSAPVIDTAKNKKDKGNTTTLVIILSIIAGVVSVSIIIFLLLVMK